MYRLRVLDRCGVAIEKWGQTITENRDFVKN